VVRWNKKVTGNVAVFDLDFHLNGLIVHVSSNAVTALVTHVGVGLRRHLVGGDASVNHFLRCRDTSCVAASLMFHCCAHSLGTDRETLLQRFIRSNGNLVTDIALVVHHCDTALEAALSKLLVANSVKFRLLEEVVDHGRSTTKASGAIVLAHNHRGVEALC